MGSSGERINKLGDVFKINRKFRLDKKTAEVNQIDANITDEGVLEVIVKKKLKVGPRVIKISTVTTKSNTTTEKATTFESTIENNAHEVFQNKEVVAVKKEEGVEKKKVNSNEDKKEEKEPTSVDDLEFEKV